MRRALVILLCLMLLPVSAARADEWYETSSGYYTVHGPSGDVLFTYAGQVSVGDEYIAEDNKYYRISSVNGSTRTATAEFVRDESMPEAMLSMLSSQNGKDKRLIAMYSTHSDESYVPTDGTESKENGKGGIYDVGAELKKELEARGIEVIYDETNHLPHDAGAYRRSRQTAVNLIKKMPAAVIDIHRDGIPDAGEYDKKIEGEDASRVRLLVGRSNPNRSANQEFAKQLKSNADKKYPGLIKDIFIGKGNYNQELMPHSILVEFGTHTTEKERAVRSTAFMAEVIDSVVFGTKSGASGDNATSAPKTSVPDKPAPDKNNPSASGTLQTGESNALPPVEQQSVETPISQSNKGAGSGILWIVGVLVIGGLAFLGIVSSSKGRFGSRVKAFGSEITGGLIGNRRKDGDEGHRDDQ